MFFYTPASPPRKGAFHTSCTATVGAGFKPALWSSFNTSSASTNLPAATSASDASRARCKASRASSSSQSPGSRGTKSTSCPCAHDRKNERAHTCHWWAYTLLAPVGVDFKPALRSISETLETLRHSDRQGERACAECQEPIHGDLESRETRWFRPL